LKQSAESIEGRANGRLPRTGRCDGKRPISKSWKCAQYWHGPRLRPPESSSAVSSFIR